MFQCFIHECFTVLYTNVSVFHRWVFYVRVCLMTIRCFSCVSGVSCQSVSEIVSGVSCLRATIISCVTVLFLLIYKYFRRFLHKDFRCLMPKTFQSFQAYVFPVFQISMFHACVSCPPVSQLFRTWAFRVIDARFGVTNGS